MHQKCTVTQYDVLQAFHDRLDDEMIQEGSPEGVWDTFMYLLCQAPLPSFVHGRDQAAARDRVALDVVRLHVVEHLQGQGPLPAFGQRADDGRVGDGIAGQALLIHPA